MSQRRVKRGKSKVSIHFEAQDGARGIGFVGTRRQAFRELRNSTAEGYTFEMKKALAGDEQHYRSALTEEGEE